MVDDKLIVDVPAFNVALVAVVIVQGDVPLNVNVLAFKFIVRVLELLLLN